MHKISLRSRLRPIVPRDFFYACAPPRVVTQLTYGRELRYAFSCAFYSHDAWLAIANPAAEYRHGVDRLRDKKEGRKKETSAVPVKIHTTP